MPLYEKPQDAFLPKTSHKEYIGINSLCILAASSILSGSTNAPDKQEAGHE
jgi:hypothetical protein